MLRKTYDYFIAQSQKPHATWALGAVSWAEASFFPIPPDIMLVPMCIANREKAWYYAFIATISSVLGGLFGYAIGALLFDTVGQWLISIYGGANAMAEFQEKFNEYGAWVIILKGLTPIPYKVVTIASGVAGYSLFWFVVLSLITRAARFYMVAAVLYYAGPSAKDFIEKRLGMVTFGFLFLIVGGLVVAAFI